MRMPSSRVRRATSYESNPYRPMHASTSARIAKKLDRRDISRSLKSVCSICCVCVRTSKSGRLMSAAATVPRTCFTSAVGSPEVRSSKCALLPTKRPEHRRLDLALRTLVACVANHSDNAVAGLRCLCRLISLRVADVLSHGILVREKLRSKRMVDDNRDRHALRCGQCGARSCRCARFRGSLRLSHFFCVGKVLRGERSAGKHRNPHHR